MPRTYASWGDWEKIGYKKKDPKLSGDSSPKKKAQQEKFGRCKICGGQMTYCKGTNILVCKNVIEKKKTKNGDGGEKIEYIVKEECGNINIVDAQYQDYMHYLFD